MCVKVCRYVLVSLQPPGSNEFDDLKMPGLYYDCCGVLGMSFHLGVTSVREFQTHGDRINRDVLG